MRRLTEHQIAVLQAMPKHERSRFWGSGLGGFSISARSACLRKGLIKQADYGSAPTYVLTEAGRLALAEQEKRHG